VSYYGFGDVDGKWTTDPNENSLAGTLVSKEDAWAGVGDKVLTNTDHNSGSGRWEFFVYLKQTGLWAKVVSGFDPATERDKLTPFCPIRNLSPKYPPILMLHGTADQDVPYEKSVEMARELARIDRPHELITLVNGRHGVWGGDPEKVLQAVDRSMEYIAEHLTKP
jgi:dipeptidyl aminopeptidase/acylaminoacyl peptidase